MFGGRHFLVIGKLKSVVASPKPLGKNIVILLRCTSEQCSQLLKCYCPKGVAA